MLGHPRGLLDDNVLGGGNLTGTQAMAANIPYRSQVGMAFAPGSDVFLDRITAGGAVGIVYSITGYLVDAN